MNVLPKLLFLIAAMVTGATSFAQAQPQSMIGGLFDLKAAVLSPAPLGPPSQFQPNVATAKPWIVQTESAASATKSPAAASETSTPRKIASSKPRHKPPVAARKPRTNPLESYATDTRRQTWPCSGGGGICAWTRR